MLNFGPRADGTVPDEYKTRLMGMGDWLKINGEAIYSTRPYSTFGEGPAPQFGHERNKPKPYDGISVRFTRNKDNDVLYATALQWPGKILTIRSLAKGTFDTSQIQSMRLLGTAGPLSWTQDSQWLQITMPEKPAYGLAYPVRIQFTSQIDDPVPVDVAFPAETEYVRFITTDGGNGCSADHAVWADAKFTE